MTATAAGVAEAYADFLDVLVIDEEDRDLCRRSRRRESARSSRRRSCAVRPRSGRWPKWCWARFNDAMRAALIPVEVAFGRPRCAWRTCSTAGSARELALAMLIDVITRM